MLAEEIQKIPYFSRKDLSALSSSEKQIELFLYRASKRGDIIRLRRGLYISRHYLNAIQIRGELNTYIEFLANVIEKPSYLSLEYVLAKYELLTEAVTTITSLTVKRPNLFENKLGVFHYKNFANKSLGSFETHTYGQFQVKQASKIQALFDYLYFKKKQLHQVNEKTVQELRINVHNLSDEDFQQLQIMVAATSSTKLQLIVKHLRRAYAIG